VSGPTPPARWSCGKYPFFEIFQISAFLEFNFLTFFKKFRKIRVRGRCGPAAISLRACIKLPAKPANKRVRPQERATSSSHVSPTPETCATGAAAAEIRSGAHPADPLDALPLLLGQVHLEGFVGAVEGLAVGIRGPVPGDM
jgi:hypothetical protein